jgi:hypothetical protein
MQQTNEQRWIQRFEELQVFYDENRHSNAPKNYKSNPKLGYWVRRQRLQYKAFCEIGNKKPCSMTQERIDMLYTVDFKFSGNKLWIQRFEDLKVFYDENRHSDVPGKVEANPKLGDWVRNQRTQYKAFCDVGNPKPCSMTQERIDMLCTISFNFYG